VQEARVVEPKPKGLCIATRCASVEDFVARFHPFCDETSIFVTTNITRPVGSESQFAILLADKTPVLRGWCIVFDAWTDTNNPYNRPGMRLGVHRLTVSSKTVMEQLLATRRVALASGKPLVQKTQPIQIEKERTATMIGLPPVREPKRPVTVKIPSIGDRPATPRTITGAVPVVVAVARTESRKIAIPTIRAKTEMAQPVVRPPAPRKPPAPEPSVVVAAEATAVDPILLDGPTERMLAPPVHVGSMGLAEVAAPVVIEPTPTPRVLAIGTSPPTAVAPIEIAEGSAKFEKPVLEEKRTPGSDMILPANPLMDLTDASLEGFIDCKLFEATQPPAPTPTPAPAPVAPPPIVALPDGSLQPQSTDWRIVMLMVLIALGAAFGISYGVASWTQQRATAAHHAQ
jgi:hypothetical protein